MTHTRHTAVALGRRSRESGVTIVAFEVDGATLHQAANDVRATRSDVDGDLSRLRGLVDQLASAWRGQAAVGFQNLMQRWDQDTAKLLAALDNIGELLDQSGTQHEVNDEAQQAEMNRIASALNP